MQVKCVNGKCLHEWDYRGQSNNYISCPICHFKFKIQRAINMLATFTNIPSDIPTNIPIKESQPIEIAPISSPYIEAPKEIDEEEFLDQEELFTEIIMKLCKKHDLPARYNDYDLDWKCKECIKSEIEELEITFTNILHANFVDVGNIKIREIKSSPQINQLSYPIPTKDSFGDRINH